MRQSPQSTSTPFSFGSALHEEETAPVWTFRRTKNGTGNASHTPICSAFSNSQDNDLADDEEENDDVMGSTTAAAAAVASITPWRKQRAIKRGVKTSIKDGSHKGDNKKVVSIEEEEVRDNSTNNNNNNNSDNNNHDCNKNNSNNSGHGALLQLLEQRAQEVRDHVTATRKWLAEKSVTSFPRKSSPSGSGATLTTTATTTPSETGTGAVSGGGRLSLAVPSANGKTRMASVLAVAVIKSQGLELSCDALVQETRLLCGSYIYHRLNSKGLMSKRIQVALHSSQVSEDLSVACQELERLYPRVYTDVSRRISMTMTSPQIVRRALTSVLEGIFRSGVTWAKLVSMVTIAAAFAEECVVQGHPDFVDDVVMCVGHFVTLNLTGWLNEQGGWAAFPTSRPQVVVTSADNSPAIVYTTSLIIVIAGVVIVFFAILLLDDK